MKPEVMWIFMWASIFGMMGSAFALGYAVGRYKGYIIGRAKAKEAYEWADSFKSYLRRTTMT